MTNPNPNLVHYEDSFNRMIMDAVTEAERLCGQLSFHRAAERSEHKQEEAVLAEMKAFGNNFRLYSAAIKREIDFGRYMAGPADFGW